MNILLVLNTILNIRGWSDSYLADYPDASLNNTQTLNRKLDGFTPEDHTSL